MVPTTRQDRNPVLSEYRSVCISSTQHRTSGLRVCWLPSPLHFWNTYTISHKLASQVHNVTCKCNAIQFSIGSKETTHGNMETFLHAFGAYMLMYAATDYLCTWSYTAWQNTPSAIISCAASSVKRTYCTEDYI